MSESDKIQCKCGCKIFEVSDFVFTFKPEFEFRYVLICKQCQRLFDGLTKSYLSANAIKSAKINGRTITFCNKDDIPYNIKNQISHRFFYLDECSSFTKLDWEKLRIKLREIELTKQEVKSGDE